MLEGDLYNLQTQVESTNETGEDMIHHLQATGQDSGPVQNKVDNINQGWNDLHFKMNELRKRYPQVGNI